MGRAPQSPRAVLFDAVGTLIHAEPCVAEIYAEVGRRHGSDLNESEIKPRFAAAFARQEAIDRRWLAGRTSEQRELRRWQRIVRQVFGPATHADAIFAELWDHFGSPAAWRLDPQVRAVWQQLEAAGYLLGVASNFDCRLLEICRAIPLLANCPRIFVSSELGWKKPAAAYFREIERRLGLSGGEIMLVGDDVENDYRAACAVGWHGVLLDAAATEPNADAIARLDELPTRLGHSST